jgi:hypothetical protein
MQTYQSKPLPFRISWLDFKTIDKLCKMNKEFEKFIEQTEKLMTASENMFLGQKRTWRILWWILYKWHEVEIIVPKKYTDKPE